MRYRLLIEASDIGRLKRCLKTMLRAFNVRVVEITQDAPTPKPYADTIPTPKPTPKS